MAAAILVTLTGEEGEGDRHQRDKEGTVPVFASIRSQTTTATAAAGRKSFTVIMSWWILDDDSLFCTLACQC